MGCGMGGLWAIPMSAQFRSIIVTAGSRGVSLASSRSPHDIFIWHWDHDRPAFGIPALALTGLSCASRGTSYQARFIGEANAGGTPALPGSWGEVLNNTAFPTLPP